ncbi:hypothetical protein [Pyrolobus fumarii]|uniref:hypothetical protein n=1 Tax=Pyrolobus fumarii TaxID=54252 RepID=UPI003CC7528D
MGLAVRLSTLIGMLLVMYLLSLVTGGFVLLANAVVVRAVSEPYIPLALRLALLALVSAWGLPPLVRVLRVRRMRWHESLVTGVITALYAAALVAAFAYDAVLGLVTGATLLARVSLVAQRGDRRRAALEAGLFTLLAVTLILVKLYVPVASARLLEEVRLGEPIDVNGLYRFIPLMTAYVYALDRIQLPTHTVYAEDSYVYYIGNHSVYNWIIEPEGFWNQLTRSPRGIILVYGDSYPPRVEIVERRLEWGLRNARFNGLYIDTLIRRVVLAAGLALRPIPENNMEVYLDGRVYILIPLESWIRGPLETIPVLAGYAVVNEKGSIEVLSPEEVAERFPFIPLLPEAIARAWVETLRYKPGFLQVYLYHNTFEVRDVGTNPQPYLTLDTRGRQWWVFVAEPPGRTYSAKYIIYVAANETSPRIRVYELPKPVVGVSMVESYVKQAHPVFDWEQLSIEEPIPAVIGGRVYWKVTVTTRDYRGLVSVDIVDAETTRVYSLQPRHHIAYLDALKLIMGELGAKQPTEKSSKDILDRIGELEEKIKRVREELDKILEELEEIKETLLNETLGQR